jgi:hypothetical protein
LADVQGEVHSRTVTNVVHTMLEELCNLGGLVCFRSAAPPLPLLPPPPSETWLASYGWRWLSP